MIKRGKISVKSPKLKSLKTRKKKVENDDKSDKKKPKDENNEKSEDKNPIMVKKLVETLDKNSVKILQSQENKRCV